MTRAEKLERVAAAILDAEQEHEHPYQPKKRLTWEDLSVMSQKLYVAMAEHAVTEWEFMNATRNDHQF